MSPREYRRRISRLSQRGAAAPICRLLSVWNLDWRRRSAILPRIGNGSNVEGKPNMQGLSTSFEINGMRLRNRLVRSATHEGLASPGGLWTPGMTAAMERLARGGVGLIITGHAWVSVEGRIRSGQSAADSDDCLGPWRETLARVHAAGAKIVLQLGHAGGRGGDARTAAGPSRFLPGKDGHECREMSLADIARAVRGFAAAARRAREAGFDGVQIHAAHGYLVSQFLSPFYNRRADAYGGPLENRARLLDEIYDAVRGEVGGGYPVLAKINTADFVPGGFTPAECAEVCRELERRGLDAVELSGGIPEAGPALSPVRTVDPAPGDPAYYEAAAREIRAGLRMPVALVGGIRAAVDAERLLREGTCDLVSLCRPLIREPELPNRWLAGEAARAECVSCNGCFRPIMTCRGLYCPRAARKSD